MDNVVIQNIKKGMAFFEEWCHSHEQVSYLILNQGQETTIAL